MFSKIPERYMHRVRWGLTIAWLGLILSLFYDPISSYLTEPGNWFASSQPCAPFQGECLPITPYPMGARIFWGMVIPFAVLTLFIFGHEAWRRICPLSFVSQLPRAMGWQRQKMVKENSWLHRHQIHFQFGLLFLGLNLRLLLVNSDRLLLGIFLILTLLSALTVGFLYGGKTWCHYFCPMAPVQMIYSEPGGLLSSAAHTAGSKQITQSMCRMLDQNGQERSACVACKSPCMDVDAEQSYWDGINRPDRQLLYYGYIGLVVGFYLYFGLYSGNWNFLSSGVWNETNQWHTLLRPGFYLAGHTIPIPKLIAVPLTLSVFSSSSYAIGLGVEKLYTRYHRRFQPVQTSEQLHNQLFTLSTFIAFNLLFFLGVRPTLGWLPGVLQPLVSWAAVLVSSLWLVKTWQRSVERYNRERDGNLLRRQLNKLNLDLSGFLEGRSLEALNPDELYALAKVLPGFSQQYRLQVYRNIVKESLEQGTVRFANSLRQFKSLRQELGIQDAEHTLVIDQILQDYPHLAAPQQTVSDEELTVRRPAKSVPIAPSPIEPTVVRSEPLSPHARASSKSGKSGNSGSTQIPSTVIDPTIARSTKRPIEKPVERQQDYPNPPAVSGHEPTIVRPKSQS